MAIRAYLNKSIRKHPSYQSSDPSDFIFGNMVRRDDMGQLYILLQKIDDPIHDEQELTPFFSSITFVGFLPELRGVKKTGTQCHNSATGNLTFIAGQWHLEISADKLNDLRDLYQMIHKGEALEINH